jgi:hypothetical protein
MQVEDEVLEKAGIIEPEEPEVLDPEMAEAMKDDVAVPVQVWV